MAPQYPKLDSMAQRLAQRGVGPERFDDACRVVFLPP
jgi:hypothetical protein